MGCQLEPHGAALREIQKSYAAKGVLLVGVDRIEHPYDVEDYLRHFGFSFPVFVDLNDDSPAQVRATPGHIALLDRSRQRARVSLKTQFEPPDTPAALDKLLGSSELPAQVPTDAPGVRRPPADARSLMPPRIEIAGWGEPVRIGAGNYPRIICYGGDKALCVWITGEVPQQQLEFARWVAGHWESPRPIRTGPDAHGVAAGVDGQGRPVIAWAQKDAQGYRVWFSALEGREWREPAAVSPPGNDAFRPDIFASPSGQLAVAWYGWKRVKLRSYPNAWWRSIYVAEVAAGKAGAPRELAQLRGGSDDCWDPVLAGTGTDVQTCWLRDENPPKLWWSGSRTNGWSRPEALLRPGTDVSELRVQACSPIRSATGRSGLVFELFSPGQPGFPAGTQVYLTTFVTNRWTDPVPLSGGSGRHVAPVGVELADGRRVLFWCHLPGKGLPSTIRMQETKGGVVPGPDRRFVSGEFSSRYPSVTVDKAGHLWLAWQTEEPNSAPAIYVSRASGKGGRES